MEYGVIVFHGETDRLSEDFNKLKNHQPVAAFVFDEENEQQALNDAWMATQNLHDSWSLNEQQLGYESSTGEVWLTGTKSDGHKSMILLKPLHVDEAGKAWGHRSSMVGDLMLVSAEGQAPRLFRVAISGSEEITHL